MCGYAGGCLMADLLMSDFLADQRSSNHPSAINQYHHYERSSDLPVCSSNKLRIGSYSFHFRTGNLPE
jgi:hypothetical protein